MGAPRAGEPSLVDAFAGGGWPATASQAPLPLAVDEEAGAGARPSGAFQGDDRPVREPGQLLCPYGAAPAGPRDTGCGGRSSSWRCRVTFHSRRRPRRWPPGASAPSRCPPGHLPASPGPAPGPEGAPPGGAPEGGRRGRRGCARPGPRGPAVLPDPAEDGAPGPRRGAWGTARRGGAGRSRRGTPPGAMRVPGRRPLAGGPPGARGPRGRAPPGRRRPGRGRSHLFPLRLLLLFLAAGITHRPALRCGGEAGGAWGTRGPGVGQASGRSGSSGGRRAPEALHAVPDAGLDRPQGIHSRVAILD